MSLRRSEERKFLEVIRNREEEEGGGGAAVQDVYCSTHSIGYSLHSNIVNEHGKRRQHRATSWVGVSRALACEHGASHWLSLNTNTRQTNTEKHPRSRSQQLSSLMGQLCHSEEA